MELTPETPLDPVMKPTLIIAITPRSGSTNLCSALTKLGAFGAPTEYFNPRGGMAATAADIGVSDANDYIRHISSRAGVFTFKGDWMAWLPFAARSAQVFPNARYAFIDRLDTEAQAISVYRAATTGRWHSSAGDAPVAPPSFDPEAIEKRRAEIEWTRLNWERWFFQNGIQPLRLVYEAFIEDIPRAASMICRHVGVDADTSGLVGDLVRTSDDLTTQWKGRLWRLRRGDVVA